MSAEEIAAEIASVDKALNAGEQVAPERLTINLTGLYKRYGWSSGGPTPLSEDAQRRLNLADRTSDPRWLSHFQASRTQLGVYRSRVGFYWLLRYESMLNEHFLDHVGAAADLEARYGKG